MNDARQVSNTLNLVGPFHKRLSDPRQITPEIGLRDIEAEILLARRHDHRRAGLCRIVKRADSIAQTGCSMQARKGQRTGSLGKAIGHAHNSRLLQAKNIFDAIVNRERVDQGQFRRAWIAENILDAFLMKKIK